MRGILTALLGILCAFGAFIPSVSGSIVSVVGQVDVVAPPPDSSDGAYTFPPGTPRFRVWQEQTNFVLPAGLAVDGAAVGIYNDPGDISTTFIPAGTSIASYFVHLDSPGGSGATAGGSITFDAPVIGIIVDGDDALSTMHLDLSDFVGAAGTIYADGLGARGMELSANEYVRIFPGSLTIDFLCNISVPGDSFRVITQIPAPAPLALGLLACRVGARRRRAGVVVARSGMIGVPARR